MKELTDAERLEIMMALVFDEQVDQYKRACRFVEQGINIENAVDMTLLEET